MFWWFYRDVDLTGVQTVLEEQNILLAQISHSISNHWADWASFGSSLIIGFIAFWVAWKQRNIMSRQHNLELFNKRWIMLEEFKALGDEYNAFQYANPLEVAKEPSKNYYLFNNKLMDFSLKVYVVFGKEVYTKFEELRKLCLEKYKKQNELWEVQRKIGLWHECVSRTLGPKEDLEKEEQVLIQEIISCSTRVLLSWGPIYTCILKIIQNSEV